MTAFPLSIRTRLFAIFACLTILVLAACSRPAQPTEPVGTPGPTHTPTPAPVGITTGTTAPEFSLHNYIGEPVSLSGLRGQAVVLYFFNTSCKACQTEMIAFQDLYTRYQAQGLTVLGINNREQSLEVADFSKNYNLTFPLLLDRDGAVASQFGVRNFPAIFFVDRNGIITQVRDKPMKTEEIDALAQQIVASVAVLPTPTLTSLPPTQVAGLEGCVTADALNVRLGPGTTFEASRLLTNGACEQFDARNADSSWLRLASPAETPRQWVSAEYIELKGDINNLPTAE